MVVSSGPHDDSAGLDEDLCTLLLYGVCVLGDIGVVALHDVLLGTLALLLLLYVLLLLLPHHAQHSTSLLHSSREVYGCVLNTEYGYNTTTLLHILAF